ncbi:hypothetical protein C9974_11595 [Marinobacter sp. B9-2]|nr:hypothetical protein C9974_11595 [Marinobacter sp. B9-2]
MTIQEINEALHQYIEGLANEAQTIADEHWRFHLRNNALLPPREKCRLNVWVRLRRHHLEIYWTHFSFFKRATSDKSGVYSKYIPKGRGNQYREKSLALRAETWEIDKVLEVEGKMAEIRAEYADVKRAITALKRVEKRAIDRRSENLA